MNLSLIKHIRSCMSQGLRRVFLLMIMFISVSFTYGTIVELQSWSEVYNGSSSPGNQTYTISTGSNSNRLLVVAVASSITGNGSKSITVSYGGQSLDLIQGNMGNSVRAHTAIYILKEEKIKLASNSTLAVSLSSGTTISNTVYAAVFDNVNQENTITSKQYSSSSDSNTAFFSDFAINANNVAVKVLSSARSGSTTPFTINNFGDNWDANPLQSTGSYSILGFLNLHAARHAVGNRLIPTSNITETSTVTMSGDSYLAMTGISINPAKYFRSRATGDWNSTNTWQESVDSINWMNANTTPTISDFTTSIVNGHTVTLTAVAGASNLHVNNGTLITSTQTLAVSKNFIIGTQSTVTTAGNSTISAGGSVVCMDGSTVEFNGAGNQNIYALNYYNLIVGGSGGTKSLLGNTSVRGDLTISRPFNAGSHILSLGGNLIQNNTFTQGTSNLSLNGSGDQTISGSGSLTLYDLNIDKPGGTVTLSKAVSVTNLLTLNNGIVNTTSTNLLTVTNTAQNAIFVKSPVNSFINGPLQRNLPASLSAASNYVFPVGIGGNYHPLTLVNPTTGSGAITATVEVFTTDAGGSIDNTLTSKNTTEYWQLSTTGNFTNSRLSLAKPTNISPFNSIAGSQTKTGVYSSLFGTTELKGVNTSELIGNNRFFAFGISKPQVTSSSYAVSGFLYPIDFGPSNILSVNISGQYLISNIKLQETSHFEISTLGGDIFTATDPLILNATGSIINPTPIYIRLKSGLPLGTYKDTLYVESLDAQTKKIVLLGEVTVGGTLTVTPASLIGFNYDFAAGPSSTQSFAVSGINLYNNVLITAPSDFEISTSSNSNFSSNLSLTPSSGTLNSTTIYVRMKAGLGVEPHVQDILISSAYTATETVSCSGTVNPIATIFNSRSVLNNFIYTNGSGPSGSETFEVRGTDLTGNIVVTAPANFQVSKDGINYSTSIFFTPINETVTPQTVYVRMISGLTSGGNNSSTYYGPAVVTLTSTGAQPKGITVSGEVVGSNVRRIKSSHNVLNGFGYAYASGGPSPTQYFTVSGASLSNNMTITPPSNFEISLSPTTGFQTTAITLTRGSSNNRIDPTRIYVRLKGGLEVGTYTQTLTIASSGGSPASISVQLLGKVYASPLIEAGDNNVGGGYCQGSTIQLTSSGGDIANQHWTGPNDYYSTDKNPSIPNAHPNMSGTYSVTGSVVVGGNLVFNGDFEAGNYGIGSGYIYKTPGSNALWDEGTYTVAASPSSVHSNFANCSNHTSGGSMQMIVNGSSIPGIVVWSQSVSVIPGADFEFSYWIQSVVAESPAQLQLYVNGVAAGPIYEASGVTCDFRQFVYSTHIPDDATMINLELINQSAAAGGNDFALDDIEFKQVLLATDSIEITINEIKSVSLTVTASASDINKGTPVTFTAHPTNPGDSPTYQWLLNGISVGTNSATYTNDNLENGDIVTCQLTSSLLCVDNPTVTSNPITMEVRDDLNFWVGSLSTEWNTANNWSAGYVPYIGDNIVFATAANNSGNAAIRDLYLDQDRTIGSYINVTDKILVIPTEKSLIVNGSIQTNNQNRILIKAEENKSNGSLIFINETLPVYGTVEMWSKAYTDETKTTSNEKYKWQFFGPPVHSYILSSLTDFYMSSVRYYNESKQTGEEGHQWETLLEDDVIYKFKGYEINQATPKKISFSGQLVKDNLNTDELPVTAGSFYKGWHLLSNPYTAAINVKDIVFGEAMEQTVYLFTTGSFTDWQTGAGAGGTEAVWNDYSAVAPGQYLAIPKNIAGFSPATSVIPSMQGFLVGVSNRISPPNTGKTVSYNYANLVKNTQMQRVKKEKEEYVYSMVTITDKNSYDKVWLFTDETCSAEYDNGWDGKKMSLNNNVVQIIATQGDKELYQIHATDDINDTYLLIYPDVDNASYTLHFKHENIESVYTQIQLYDNVTKKLIDITDDDSEYTFTASKNDNPTRFKIITETVDYQTRNIFVYPMWVENKNIFIENNTTETGIARIYDISGQLIGTQIFNASSETKFNVIYSGIYIIQVETNQRKAAQKVIVY